MTVTDLVSAFLYEAALDKLSAQAKRALAKTEFGAKEVGVDTGKRPISYVERWGNETGYVWLEIDPIVEREPDWSGMIDD